MVCFTATIIATAAVIATAIVAVFAATVWCHGRTADGHLAAYLPFQRHAIHVMAGHAIAVVAKAHTRCVVVRVALRVKRLSTAGRHEGPVASGSAVDCLGQIQHMATTLCSRATRRFLLLVAAEGVAVHGGQLAGIAVATSPRSRGPRAATRLRLVGPVAVAELWRGGVPARLRAL